MSFNLCLYLMDWSKCNTFNKISFFNLISLDKSSCNLICNDCLYNFTASNLSSTNSKNAE